MVWMTAVADSRCALYEAGSSMSPLAQVTLEAHGGGSGDEVTLDQCGVPERETETTDQPRWAAARQMRLPVQVSAVQVHCVGSRGRQPVVHVRRGCSCRLRLQLAASRGRQVGGCTYPRSHCRRTRRASSALRMPLLQCVVRERGNGRGQVGEAGCEARVVISLDATGAPQG